MGNRRSGGPAAKVLAIGVVACLISAGCSTAVTSTRPSTLGATPHSTPTPSCVVGEAWNNYSEEEIALWDQPALEKPIVAGGYGYDWVDAKSSSDTQRTQIDEFIAKGVKVIVIRVQGDGEGDVPPATKKAIDRAVAAGVPVIAFDYLVDDPKVLWVSFDEVEIGRVEARAILAAAPKGNYVILRGTQGSPLEGLMASGIHEVLQPAVDRGDIKIVAEPYTHWWDPGIAQTEMEQILVENNNKIDAVIAETDGMAGGAIDALKNAGLAGKVAVAGQGGDTWALNQVAAGVQTVDVWPDPRLMGTAAGNAAVALCQHPDIATLTGTTLFSSPGHNQIPSILLTPQAITKDNLDAVLDAGWTKKADLCASIDPSGAPSVCR